MKASLFTGREPLLELAGGTRSELGAIVATSEPPDVGRPVSGPTFPFSAATGLPETHCPVRYRVRSRLGNSGSPRLPGVS